MPGSAYHQSRPVSIHNIRTSLCYSVDRHSVLQLNLIIDCFRDELYEITLLRMQCQVQDVVNGLLLPAMMLVPAHPALMLEAWNVLQLFAYPMRFRFYHLLQACAHLV